MNLKALSTKLKYESAWDGWDDRDVTGAFSSDLLSDVMAHSDEGQLLITIQAHKNTVAVAVLKDLAGLVIASNRPIHNPIFSAHPLGKSKFLFFGSFSVDQHFGRCSN